jgi:hypothetical protein
MNLKIQLHEKYKSFLPGFETELEGSLLIISGINGSGKTQLIDIIKGYKPFDINSLIARIITQDDIEIDNGEVSSKSFREYHGLAELTSASVTQTTTSRDQIFNWYTQAKFEYYQHNQIVQAQFRGVAKKAKQLLIDTFGQEAFNNGTITREDIKRAIPSDFILFEDDIFTNKIGELFFNHASLVYKKQHEAGVSGVKFDESKLPISPWKTLNDLFAKLRFSYRFKDEYLRVDDEIDEQPAIYALKEDGSIDLSEKRSLNEL